MNDIVKFKSDTGQDVQITMEDVQKVLCPNATPKETMMFLQLCAAQKLNPWVRDVYAIKYGNSPMTIVTGKEVFTKRANANKDYEGFEGGVTFLNRNGAVRQREGSAVYKAAGETLLGGWCRVFVKGRKPFYDEVTLDEYSTGKSGWAKMPATMIRKVALVHALREAFPDDFRGLYSQEEMGEVSNDALPSEPIKPVEPVEAVTMITDAQRKEIAAKVDMFADMRGRTTADVTSALIGSKALKAAGAVQGQELTEAQAEAAIKLLDMWILKAADESSKADEAQASAEDVRAVEQAVYSAHEAAEGEYYETDVEF